MSEYLPIIGEGALVDRSLFVELHERALNIDANEVDKAIKPLIGALNRLPGIATVWSCAGHGGWLDGYLTLVGDRSQLHSVSKFLESIIAGDSTFPGPSFEMEKLVCPPVPNGDEEEWYPVFTFRWASTDIDFRDEMIRQMFSHVLDYEDNL